MREGYRAGRQGMKTGKGDRERETAGVRQEERDMERDTRKQRGKERETRGVR